jgi:hypothetical protein
MCPEISQSVFDLGVQWARDPKRPQIPRQTFSDWTVLIGDWIANSDLPLLVRKAQNNRGSCILGAGGRKLIPTDNSPAQWAFAYAHSGRCPSVQEIVPLLERSELPVAMILKGNERQHAIYKGVRSKCLGTSDNGWKLALIVDVALGGQGPIETYSFDKIAAHFARFMSPANMFVVPAEFAGLAEVTAFIKGYCSICGEFSESRQSPQA